jgi:hypothetical protein
MRRVSGGRFVDIESPRGYVIDHSGLALGWTDSELPPTPGLLARVALGDLELYLGRGTPSRRDRFARAADRLVRSVEMIPGGFSGWAMPRPPAAYQDELDEGWFSGSVHAECVAVLVRAKSILGDDDALECARAAFGGFETPVEEGGFAREIAEAGAESGLASALFIEAFPVSRPSLNLLGHTTAMLAVHDYGRLTQRDRAADLFERCAAGLDHTLERFDAGGWSLVDLDDRWRGTHLAAGRRHREHILHLEELARLSSRGAFGETAARWREAGARTPFVLRARTRRLAFRIANPGAPTAEEG